MNPFPSLEPLCPWQSPEHAGHYAEVDHSRPAYERFQQAVGDGARLTVKGMTVLATGGSGCGKTSLMHRCAFWLRHHPPAGHQVKIVDLTGDGRHEWGSEQRVRHFFQRAADDLEPLFDAGHGRLLDERRDDLDRLVPTLASLLGAASHVAAVLLPPAEVPQEIARYAGLARGRLLLFAETSFEHVAAECARRLGPASATPVLGLAVGELTEEDGWRYVRHHFDRSGGAGAWPDVAPETLRRIIGKRGRMSVRELQMLLHGKYQEAAEAGQAGATTLTFEDFTEYYFRTASLT